MDKKSKIVAYFLIGAAIIAFLSLWFVPDAVRIAEATEYTGAGGTYQGSSGSQSQSQPPPSSSSTAPPSSSSSSQNSSSQSSSADEDSGINNVLDDIQKSLNKLDDSFDPNEFSDIKAPAWVEKVTYKIREQAARIAITLQTFLFGIAGAWYMHGLFAILADWYFYLFTGFKFSFFSKAVTEVKASAGIMPKQRQQSNNSSYGYQGNQYNNSYNNNMYNNANQYNNTSQSTGNNGEHPSIWQQIINYTIKQWLLVITVLILIVIVQLGYFERSILLVLTKGITALGAV